MFTRSHTRPFRSSIRVCSFQLVATNKSRQNFNLPPFDRSQFPKNHRRPRTQLLLCRWCDLLKLFKVSLIQWQFEPYRDIFVRDLESLIQEKEKKPVFLYPRKSSNPRKKKTKDLQLEGEEEPPRKRLNSRRRVASVFVCVCIAPAHTHTVVQIGEKRERLSRTGEGANFVFGLEKEL